MGYISSFYVSVTILVSNELDILHKANKIISQLFNMKGFLEGSYKFRIKIHIDKSCRLLRSSRKGYIDLVL